MSEDKDLISIGQARSLVRRARAAQSELELLSQDQIDAVVSAMAAAAARESRRLARAACDETGIGIAEDKHVKNEIAFHHVYEYIKGMRTVGVISRDSERRVAEIAAPVGVIAGVIPVTNPTSTTIFKVLISIKARNAIVLSPHPAALDCIVDTARVMEEAGRAAGLPADSILCMQTITAEGTEELMRLASLVVATGGQGLVRAAYSSGTPAFGVGPGNVPAYVHSSADLARAADDILTSKCFDNGTVCASEQAVVVDRAVAAELRGEFERSGAHFLTAEQTAAVARALVSPELTVNPKLVGKAAHEIARAAGFQVPEGKKCLIAKLDTVGPDEPLSIEKLSPVLAYYEVEDWREGCERCRQILAFGGMGHSLAIHARDEEVINAFALAKPASRILVNTPATHGAIGYSTGLAPSLTLGCGAAGSNITSDNISPMHLLDIKRLAYGTRPVGRPDSPPDALEGKPEPAPAPLEESATAVPRERIEQMVDEFLDGKKTKQLKPSPNVYSIPEQGETQDQPPRPAPPPPEAPTPAAAEFVSEWEVRQALKRGETILIDEKTIITPLARELAERESVFMLKGSITGTQDKAE